VSEKSVLGNEFYHVGVLLGKDKIAHYSTTDNRTSYIHVPFFRNLRRKFKIIITDISVFLENQKGDLYCHHSIIPFNHINKVLLQTKKSLMSRLWRK